MIDFGSKTYTGILKRQLARIPDTLDKREGSVIQMALGPSSWYLEGVYLDLAFALSNMYVDTACGAYLDRIAVQNGILRKPATYTVRLGEFNTRIPKGARFSVTDGSRYITYIAEDDAESDKSVYTCRMRCETAGTAGNGYSGKAIPIDYIRGLTQAEITDILSEGSEEESDEALRARILAKVRQPSTSGNRYDYYNWAMECEGVGAARVFPLANGPGTVRVIIADAGMSAAGTGLIQEVRDHIEELRPIGADVTVASVVERAVNLSVAVRLRAGMNLGVVQNAFLEELTVYLRREALDMSYISLARVGNLLLGTDGVEDYTGLLLNGTAGNVHLSEEEIAVTGTVTLEVM